MKKQDGNLVDGKVQDSKELKDKKDSQLEESWAEDAQGELEDFIESQGIYIRQ